MQAEAAAEQARRSLDTAAAPQDPSSRRASRNRGSLDSGASGRRRESFDSVGSAGTGAGGRRRESFDSAAGSPSGGEETTGSPPPPPPPRAPGAVSVGGWVRQESVVGAAAGGSSSSLSPPLPPSRGASPAERGGRVVGRWVRRSGVGSSRDSSLSVSPVLPLRKPPSGAGAGGDAGGIKRRGGGDRASLDSTAAAVEQDGGRDSTGSAAGLAVAAEEHERAQAKAAFARDTDLGMTGPKDGTLRISTSPVVSSSQTKDQVVEARWDRESGSQGGTDRDSFEAGAFSPRVTAAAEKDKSWRRSRSRSESVVDNEGLQVTTRHKSCDMM